MKTIILNCFTYTFLNLRTTHILHDDVDGLFSRCNRKSNLYLKLLKTIFGEFCLLKLLMKRRIERKKTNMDN